MRVQVSPTVQWASPATGSAVAAQQWPIGLPVSSHTHFQVCFFLATLFAGVIRGSKNDFRKACIHVFHIAL